jgi:hypothetical protein
MAATTYNLTGQDGIQVFTDLPEGTKVTLTDGAVGNVTANPRDGGFIMVKYSDHPNASMVGTEELVFFNQVVTAVGE